MIKEERKFKLYQSPFQPENFQSSVLQAIEQKAKEIIEKTNSKLQDIVSKGYQEGFQKGYSAGLEKVNKEKDEYLKNAQKEFADRLNELKQSMEKTILDYKEFTKNACKLFFNRFISKYVKQKIEVNEQVLFNAIDELFQYISTSTIVKLIINKKYQSYATEWLENKTNEGYKIEIAFNEIDTSEAFIIGHDIYARVDFNLIINKVMEKYPL